MKLTSLIPFVARSLFCILLFTMALAATAKAQDYGLDAPEPVGAFLDGSFPSSTPGPTGAWTLTDALPNLSFVDPVRVVTDPQLSDTLYIVCRNGEIWRVPNDPNASSSDRVRFLDRRANTWGYWDCGMLGLAFHPSYGQAGNPNRGYVYVFYQYLPQQPSSQNVNNPSYMRLSRFTVPDGANQVDPNSEYIMIQQFDRHNWHNGGEMFFGADGFLHLVVGDEGDANDSHNQTQRINQRLFSGILRIDVDRDPSRSHPIRRQPAILSSRPSGWPASFTQGYYIPNDNPWQDPDGGILEEFWTIGLRSPHSMHLDKETGNIWIAEIGQGAREEITLARKAGNHQWPFKEGSINGPKARPSNLIGTEVPPVYDYGRSLGGCIIGGVVYRGTEHAGSLTGKYIFGDHNTRSIWAMTHTPGQAPQVEYLTSVFRSGGTKQGLAGITAGPDGEVYICELGNTGTQTGKIYKLSRLGTPVPNPPTLLSQTGAFTNLETLTPRSGLLPYDLNSPLWSDNAEKKRWIAIPNDGTHNTSGEQINFSENDNWEFPIGTVIVKHFELPIDAQDPTRVRRLETRFLVKGNDDKYYGVTYRWNNDGTDAQLLHNGLEEDIPVTQANGSIVQQKWSYPSRTDCLTCHTTNSGSVLGLRTHQLNLTHFFEKTGRQDNLLRTWNHLGIFSPSLDEEDIPTYHASAGLHDSSRPIIDRVRSWLDSNCAQCHQPGGVFADFDARYTTPFEQQNLVNGSLRGTYGVSNPAVIKPGDLARSILYQRDNSLGDSAMPPLAKNLIHHEAMEMMAEWIENLDNNISAPLTGSYYTGQNFNNLVLTRNDGNVNFEWGGGSPASSIPNDNFSVRWTGMVTPAYSERYRFYTTTDDGVRLWVNGQLLVNRWVDQSATEHSGTIDLTAGTPVNIVMEFYENGGDAVAKLAWSSNRRSKQIIPASAFSSGTTGNPPSATLATASNAVNSSFDVSLQFSRPVSGLVEGDFILTNGSISSLIGESDSYLLHVTPDSFGTVRVSLPENAAFDANGRGNASSNTIEVTYSDTTRPELVLSTETISTTGSFLVNADFSEPVTGFTSSDITVAQGEVSNFNGSGANYDFTVTPNALGDITVSVAANQANDASGNGNTASNTLTVAYQPASDEIVYVYLMAGQSNMSGAGQTADLPSSLREPQNDIDFFYRIPGEEDVFTTLRPGASDDVDFGPEITFGRTIADFHAAQDPEARVAIIKYSRGATDLHEHWKGNGDSTTDGDGSEYRIFQEVVSNGLQALQQEYPGATLSLGGFLWHQGEADVLQGETENYAAHLATFIEDLRATYHENLPFIYARLASGQAPAFDADNFAELRDAQSNVNDPDNDILMLDTDGMEVFSTEPIILSANGLQDLGVAYAEGLRFLSYDEIRPLTVNLATPFEIVSAPFSVHAHFNKPVSGLTLDDFTVVGGTATAISGHWSDLVITITPSGPSSIEVSLPQDKATDPLGAPNPASNLVAVTYSPSTEPDSLDSVLVPSLVRSGETATVTIAYQASTRRDLQAVLHDSENDWEIVGQTLITVEAGGGTAELDVDVAASARVGDGYIWATRLLPEGGDFSQALAEDFQATSVEQGTSEPVGDALDEINVPSIVRSGEVAEITIDYRASVRRDLQVVLHDSVEDWRILATQLIQVEAGTDTAVMNIPIEADARVGEGYVWATRLLPEGADFSEALIEDFQAATMEAGIPSGDADALDEVIAPSLVRSGEMADVTIRFRATTTRDLQIILHDSQDAWRTVASHIMQVTAGTGTAEVQLPVEANARVGDGYLWAIRLIPQGSSFTEAIAERYQSASMEEGSGGAIIDAIDRLGAPTSVERGRTAVVEVDFRATQPMDLQLLLHDAEDNWRTVGQGLGQVDAGQGTATFNLTIAADARPGEGYVWAVRLIPEGMAFTDAVAERYQNAEVTVPTDGGAVQDAVTGFSAPTQLVSGSVVNVRVNYEATTTRDLNVVILDSLNGWRLVGEARAQIASGIGARDFSIGISANARLGEGYVWVAQLLPSGSSDGTSSIDERYVNAAVVEALDTEEVVNFSVLPSSRATQSSTYGSAFVADLARDGNSDGDWRNGSVTHTDNDGNAWWEIDLGSSKSLTDVVLWNRTDCCEDRLTDFYVLVSSDPFASTDLEASLQQSGVSSFFIEAAPSPTQQIILGRSGRYIRIQLANEGYLSLAEVQVRGQEEGTEAQGLQSAGLQVAALQGDEQPQGLSYQYYEGVWNELPDFSSLPVRKMGTATDFNLSSRLREDFYAFRFSGAIYAPENGDYTFRLESSSPGRLLLHGLPIVDQGIDPNSSEQVVELASGWHPIEVHYYESEGEDELSVQWSGPGFEMQALSGDVLGMGTPGDRALFDYGMPQFTADDNRDGDLLDLTAEYALGLNPYESAVHEMGLRVTQENGELLVLYDRPKGLEEFTYTLEASTNLTDWTDILGSEIQPLEGARERVVYRRLDQHEALSEEVGFVRLRIHHHYWNHTTWTPVFGWQSTAFHAGHQTYGPSLMPNPIFASTIADLRDDRIVASANGLAGLLNEGTTYLLEIMDGPLEGHRVVVDSEQSGDQTIGIDWAHSLNTLESYTVDQLVNSGFVIHPITTLEERFPKEKFTGSDDPASADQLLFFHGEGYESYFLLEAGGMHRWTASDSTDLEDVGSHLMAPGIGSFVKLSDNSPSTELLSMGYVREHAFIQPLKEGYNLVAPSAPLTVSPLERGLAIDRGFLGSTNPASADQIHYWIGDYRTDPAEAEQEGFGGLFLLDAGEGSNIRYWTALSDTDLTDLSESRFLPGDRAFFIKVVDQDHPTYQIPRIGE